MVDLVLHTGRQQALAGHLPGLAVTVEVAHRHLGWPHHVGIVLRHRQAAFLVGRVLVGGLDDLGIGHQDLAGLEIFPVDVEHDDAPELADLPGASYIVSSMSSISWRTSASTESTGLDFFLRRGSGAVRMVRMAMTLKYAVKSTISSRQRGQATVRSA